MQKAGLKASVYSELLRHLDDLDLELFKVKLPELEYWKHRFDLLFEVMSVLSRDSSSPPDAKKARDRAWHAARRAVAKIPPKKLPAKPKSGASRLPAKSPSTGIPS